jgi:pimeloyl-ACP methyl ester carboxylesterase
MQLHHIRRGSGKPLLLVPGLGATWQSWDTILDALAREREVIAVDLPGFGATPPLTGEISIATLTDAVETFIAEQGLAGITTVGSSMGARTGPSRGGRNRCGAGSRRVPLSAHT